MHRRLVLGCATGFLFAFLALLGGCNGASNAARDRVGQDGDKGFMVKTVKRGIWTRKYGLFVPLSYHPGTPQKYPVIIFLHGIGEGDGLGEGDLKNMTVGLGPAVARKAEQFQFIVIFPQSGGTWSPDSEYVSDMFAALDQVSRDYPVDQDRVILTGVSTGGAGTWAIGAKYHDRFAALAPMASNGSDPGRDADSLVHTPVRAYCSSVGDIFAGWNDQSMVNRIKELNPNADARFTATPTFGHDCWEDVYGNDELFAWMGQQRRSGTVVARQAAPTPVIASAAPAKVAPAKVAPAKVTPAKTVPVASAQSVRSTPAAAPARTVIVTAPPTPTRTVVSAPRTVAADTVVRPVRASAPMIATPAPRPTSSAEASDNSWVNTPW